MFAAWRRHLSRKRARSGEAAMERGDWEQAQKLFSEALHLRPDRIELQTQLGHAFKEMGSFENAARHYQLAAARDNDALYHLCVLYAERNDRDNAGRFLTTLLMREPESIDGYRAMSKFGLENKLPLTVKNNLRVKTEAGINKAFDQIADLIDRAHALMSEDVLAYDRIRTILVPDPPSNNTEPHLHIIVDSRKFEPYHLRSTLFSLMDSVHKSWRASIVMDDLGVDHPILGIMDLDRRFNLCTSVDVAADEFTVGVLYTSAGVNFCPQALGWFAYLWESGSARLWTCDWDYKTPKWDSPAHHSNPVLSGTFDLDLLLASDGPPPLLGVYGKASLDVGVLDGEERRLKLADLAMDGVDVAHIPLPLVSLTRIPQRADQAREKGEILSTWPAGWGDTALSTAVRGPLTFEARNGRPPLTCGKVPNESEPIRVIIPTRDCADMLKDMVESLQDCADHADHVRITVVDNRSSEEATKRLLNNWLENGKVTVIDHDAPFNWAHMNNLAVQASDEPLLVFANNDMRMLGSGWDARIRGQLNRPDVGVVGARLLYPDGTLQHAGMMLGLAEGSPVHIGVYGADAAAADDPDYDRVRSVACVTGAFMGVTRRWFEQLGRFDAIRFPVAYNDVDFCLSSRMGGKKVLFDPGIELTHFESHSRGLNDSRAKIAWDQGELGLLFSKWGQFSIQDPYISPLRSKPSLRGLTPATKSQILSHIDTSIRHNGSVNMGAC